MLDIVIILLFLAPFIYIVVATLHDDWVERNAGKWNAED